MLNTITVRRFVFIVCMLIVCNAAKSQVKAITETGREVILYNNGSWKYIDDSSKNELDSTVDSIKTNHFAYTKPASSNFLVKSKIFNVGVYIDPKKWTFSGHKDNEPSIEYRFGLKTADGYMMMIAEKTSIDLEIMREIALSNAQKASLDVKEINAEYRTVNKLKVLCLQLSGTIKSMKFTYFGYYYSNKNGTVQLVGYTSQKYFDQTKKELENILNGLVETSD